MIRAYQVSCLSNGPFGGYIYAEIQNTGSNVVKIYQINLEVEDSSNGQPSNSIGLGRGSANGTLTTSFTPQALDGNEPTSGVRVGTAWGGDATFPTNYFTRDFTPATNGEGKGWSWSREAPLILPPSKNLCVMDFNGATGGNALTVTMLFEE